MSEDIITTYGIKFAEKVYELIKPSLVSFIKDTHGAIKNEIYSSSDKYVRSFIERHGYIKILRMPKPINIDDVFINVGVIDEITNSQYFSEETLLNKLKTNNRLFDMQNFLDKEIDGITIANDEQYLFLLGSPGAGKSTLLRKIAIESLKQSKDLYKVNYLLPVFIELKKINNHDLDIRNYIVNEFRVCGFPNPDIMTDSALRDGKLLILLDGLDEVPKDIAFNFQNKVIDFVDRYDKNRYIISCRIAAKPTGFQRFKNVELLPFTIEKIEEFVKNWFSSPDDIQFNIAETFIKKIEEPDYSAAIELASTPLLLTMLCLVFQSEQDFPKNRSILYKHAIDILLKEWSSEKRINREPIYKDLTLPLEELMLSKLAYENFIVDKLFFSEEKLAKFISHFLHDNINAEKYLDSYKIIHEISLQQGLLVERAVGIFSFSHLTFQEFFTAKYIDDFGLIDTIIDSKINDKKWREVFLLLAGLMKAGADKLLNAIFVQINKNRTKSIDNYAKKLALKFDKDSYSIRDKLFLTAIFLYIYPSQQKAVLHSLVNAIKKIDTALAYDINYIWIIDGTINNDLRWRLLKELLSKSKNTNSCTREIYELMCKYDYSTIENFKNELEAKYQIKDQINYLNGLEKYLDLVTFLLECKNSALLVSREPWEILQRRIL
ncbi:MAG: NACHT domain-containing protein [Bacteroidetes bacterium]|nr:NACHT domain-containing protein [Bacteroidota bacterium]